MLALPCSTVVQYSRDAFLSLIGLVSSAFNPSAVQSQLHPDAPHQSYRSKHQILSLLLEWPTEMMFAAQASDAIGMGDKSSFSFLKSSFSFLTLFLWQMVRTLRMEIYMCVLYLLICNTCTHAHMHTYV